MMRASLLARATAALLSPLTFDFEGADLHGMGIARSFGAREHGRCAVDEEHCELGIPTLADGSEATCEPGRVLLWCQAEVRGEMST